MTIKKLLKGSYLYSLLVLQSFQICILNVHYTIINKSKSCIIQNTKASDTTIKKRTNKTTRVIDTVQLSNMERNKKQLKKLEINHKTKDLLQTYKNIHKVTQRHNYMKQTITKISLQIFVCLK